VCACSLPDDAGAVNQVPAADTAVEHLALGVADDASRRS
jgi:hypothetical protein